VIKEKEKKRNMKKGGWKGMWGKESY